VLRYLDATFLDRVRQKTLRPNLTPAEGFILGVGAKMFTIADPVIVYGLSAGVLYGLIYWIIGML